MKKLYDTISAATVNQGRDLENTLVVANDFWNNYDDTTSILEDIRIRLDDEEPAAVEPECLIRQQHTLAVSIFKCY